MKEELIPSRLAKRATDNSEKIRKALEASLFCTVSYACENRAFSIPTGFCLADDKLYIHGSVKSHFLLEAKDREVCISTFLFDGLVLAGSAFHHSVNYRSVILFAQATEITDEVQKTEILKTYTNRYVPGRWDEVRPVNEGELKASMVLGFDLQKASLKVRNGPPSFDPKDYRPGLWTGVIPSHMSWGEPVPDPNREEEVAYPNYFKN